MSALLDFKPKDTFSLEKFLSYFDFLGAAKYYASETPTPIDDYAIPYVADIIREQFIERLSPQPMAFAASTTTEEQITDAANAMGLTLSPFVIGMLLKFSWPVIERLLTRWAKR